MSIKPSDIIEIFESVPQILIVIEPRQIRRAVAADDLINAVCEFSEWLRQEYKYKDNEAAAPIREKLYEILNENGVDPEQLQI